MKKSNVVKIALVAASFVVLTGCASSEEKAQIKTDVVNAQQTADTAMSKANEALSKANAAMDAANAAQAAADESSERARRMMEKNMAK